jgi:hypothetical protein
MLSRFNRCFVAMSLAALGLTLAPPSANACGGGMFTIPAETETTTLSGHRVAISISTDQTVLWDQIQYQGDPKDFAWVMPVKTGAKIGVGSDAWLEALDAATAPVISSQVVQCFGGGSDSSGGSSGACGSGDGNVGSPGRGNDGVLQTGPDVTVVHSATVGPYDTVTLSSTTPGALGTWLDMHGYVIPADVKPILDDYAAQGFDFIAVRLAPGQGVAQIKPLRVVTKGALTTFPMRMLAAGAKKNVALSLFVITEGRSAIKGYSSAKITGAELTWDFAKEASDYAAVRAQKLAADSGRTFLTTYAQPRTLLAPLPSPDDPVTGPSQPPLATTFFAQALENKEVSGACPTALDQYAESMAKVTSTPGSGETDPTVFACEKADDLGVALTGLHPNDVWVTRFEADLPREALTADLTIEPAASEQTPLHNRITAEKALNDACGSAASASIAPAGPRRSPRDASIAAVLLGLGLAVTRRFARSSRARATKPAST